MYVCACAILMCVLTAQHTWEREQQGFMYTSGRQACVISYYRSWRLRTVIASPERMLSGFLSSCSVPLQNWLSNWMHSSSLQPRLSSCLSAPDLRVRAVQRWSSETSRYLSFLGGDQSQTPTSLTGRFAEDKS